MISIDKLMGRSNRRDWLRLASFGALGVSTCGWLDVVAQRARAQELAQRAKAKACIVLFMNGGPAHTFTFDMKTGPNGCPFRPIDTSAPGVQISEYFPRIARQMHKVALVRGMTTAIADHAPARYLMRTGFRPAAGFAHPCLGSRIAHELVNESTGMPNFVHLQSVGGGMEGVGPGFLPPATRPLILRNIEAGLANLNPAPYIPGGLEGARERMRLLEEVDLAFIEETQAEAARAKLEGYRKALELMDLAKARTAFQVEKEPDRIQDAYGKTIFGKHCLGARRLLENGVKYVEVMHPNNWDTHNNTIPDIARNSNVLDQPMAALLRDLEDRGLLDETLVIWMGDFGRDFSGSHHHARAWTTAFAGAGVRGGQIIGGTDNKGMEVRDRPVKASDFAATVYTALGIDFKKETMVRNRPIKAVDGEVNPVVELFS